MNMGTSTSSVAASASVADTGNSSAASQRCSYAHEDDQQLQQQIANAANYLPPLDEEVVGCHDPCKDGTATEAVVLDTFEKAIDNKQVNSRGEPVKMPTFYRLENGKNIFETIPQAMLEQKNFVLADMSVKPEVSGQLTELCNRFLNIDHHGFQQKDVEAAPSYIFSKKACSAVLMHLRMKPNEPVPEFLKYIDDGDNFLWRMPHSRAVNEFMSSLRQDPQNFKALMNHCGPETMDAMIRVGYIMLENKQRQFAGIVSKKETVTFLSSAYVEDAGVPFNQVEICHVPGFNFVNEIAWMLLDNNKQAGCAVITYPARGDKTFAMAVRSVPNRYNAAAVASLMAGGGGHVCAAGMQNFSFFTDQVADFDEKKLEGLTIVQDNCRPTDEALVAMRTAIRNFMIGNYAQIPLIPEDVTL